MEKVVHKATKQDIIKFIVVLVSLVMTL